MVNNWEIIQGDALEVLRYMPSELANCCITSPPYWSLRDYQVKGQIGLEETFLEYIDKLTEVFREVKRVLRNDGTCWIVVGDSHAGSWNAQGRQGKTGAMAGRTIIAARQIAAAAKRKSGTGFKKRFPGLKPKDLIGIPWRIAFALQDDGWFLRSDIIWNKPSPLPESVKDRPSRAHEYVFLMAKSRKYYYNADAVRVPYSEESKGRYNYAMQGTAPTCRQGDGNTSRREREKGMRELNALGRKKRTVWTVASQPFTGNHPACFPPKLIEPCILAGCPLGGIVLDPFAGAGTTGLVALRHNRNFIGIELNPEYVEMAQKRIIDDAPLLNIRGDD